MRHQARSSGASHRVRFRQCHRKHVITERSFWRAQRPSRLRPPPPARESRSPPPAAPQMQQPGAPSLPRAPVRRCRQRRHRGPWRTARSPGRSRTLFPTRRNPTQSPRGRCRQPQASRMSARTATPLLRSSIPTSAPPRQRRSAKPQFRQRPQQRPQQSRPRNRAPAWCVWETVSTIPGYAP